MRRLPLFALACALVFAGCARYAALLGEDLPRLERIDRRFTGGDYDYALAETEKYLKQYPRSYKGWTLLGWVYLKFDRLDKARECFDKSLSINPRWDNAHVGRGAAYRKAGDNANARKSYLEAISIVPDNAEAFSSLLVVEILEGNNEKAVEYGEKAWALRKDLPSIPANLATAYHYLGDHAKRDHYYKQAERMGYNNLQNLKNIFDGKVDIR